MLVDGGTYHVLTRGNNAQPVFHHEADFQRYLNLLSEYAKKYHLKIYHFVLMPNHVHLVMEIIHGHELSKAMSGLNLSYSMFYKKRYRYSGHLWQGRFKSLRLDPTTHLLMCGRYIEMSPVREGLANDPVEYPWSSHRVYAAGHETTLVTPNPYYQLFGATPAERQHGYRQFVLQGLSDAPPAASVAPPPAIRIMPQSPKTLEDVLGLRRTRKRHPLSTMIAAIAMLTGMVSAYAQGTNGVYTLTQDFISAGGGSLGGGNPMQAQTALGVPVGGRASNGTYTLLGGLGGASTVSQPVTHSIDVSGTVDASAALVEVNGTSAVITGTTFLAEDIPLTAGLNTVTAVARDTAGNQSSASITVILDLPADDKEPRFSIPVTGTVNDATAAVSVNGVAAPISSGQFTAMVGLTSGYNTITSVATDAAGNQASDTIGVFVPPITSRPPMPTVGTVGTPIPSVTTLSSITIGGTKTPGTSIWINGSQVVAANDSTQWSAAITLVEGDNALVIVAKDSVGTPSAAATINVVRDNLPPVVTFAPPAKTNLNPVPLNGSVDDSLTTVTVNGIIATRAQRDFSVPVPLAAGSTPIHLVAVSPNGYSTVRDYSITLGTVPTIQSMQPADGAKLYIGTATAMQATATDQQGDPIQYQFSVDGTPVGPWSSSASTTVTPAISDVGIHTVTATARDDYGGSDSEAVEVFVVRTPVQHP